MAERRNNPWVAFAAGAVAMLALALVWYAWLGRDEAGVLARAASEAAQTLPLDPLPKLPDAPRLPNVPVPVPK